MVIGDSWLLCSCCHRRHMCACSQSFLCSIFPLSFVPCVSALLSLFRSLPVHHSVFADYSLPLFPLFSPLSQAHITMKLGRMEGLTAYLGLEQFVLPPKTVQDVPVSVRVHECRPGPFSFSMTMTVSGLLHKIFNTGPFSLQS